MNEIIKKREKILVAFLVLFLLILVVVCGVLVFSGDRKAPSIIIDEEYLATCDLNDEDDVVSAASAVDNVTENVEIIVVDIMHVKDQSYKIYFAAQDEAGNSTMTSVTVENDTVLENEMHLNNEETTETEVTVANTEETTEEVTTELVTLSPDAPVVKLTTDKVSMNIGDVFSYMDYIDSITDDKDDELDLYRRIRVEGYYNTNSIGDYEIEYFVKDSDGNKSNVATIVLKVRDNN